MYFCRGCSCVGFGQMKVPKYVCNWKNEAPRLHPGSNRQVWMPLPACSIGARCEVYGNNVWTFPTYHDTSQIWKNPGVTGSCDHAFNWIFSKMCIKFSCKKDLIHIYWLSFGHRGGFCHSRARNLLSGAKQPKKPNPKNPVVLWFCHGKAFLDSTRFTSSASQRMLVKKDVN